MDDVYDLAQRIARLKGLRQETRRRLARWRRHANGNCIRSCYSSEHGWLIELDNGRPPSRQFERPDLAADDLVGVQLAELELLNEQEPAYRAGVPAEGDPEAAIFVDVEHSCWALYLPCEECRGFWLRLPVSTSHHRFDPASIEARFQRELARAHSHSLIARLDHPRQCAGCTSNLMRSAGKGHDEGPWVWLDVDPGNQGWQVWVPFAEGGVSLPLDLPAWATEAEVDAAARDLVGTRQGGEAKAPYDWEADDGAC